MLRLFTLAICAFGFLSAQAQQKVPTANEVVPEYNASFGQGINFGWYQNWTDEDLARLSTGSTDGQVRGIGVNALRPALFSWFLEQHGYGVRESTFKFYDQLGAKNNVAIIGHPNDEEQSTTDYCGDGVPSMLHRGMWEPIWDGGANGTPYNDNNLYAKHVYKTVMVYGDEVRFWEVWNEPDINYSGNGWKDRRFEGNWYDNDPEPCELMIHAPIQAYVRMLRITWEIVKSIDPNDYVAIGGVGFPSFMDAIMRHTDEEGSGAVTGENPLLGGAYFDAISYHIYPHLEDAFREWNNDKLQWDYHRHSDRAIKGVGDKLKGFEKTAADYGYDGKKYPKKVTLCTEVNLPRRGFDLEAANLSSVQMQRNFILKLLARSQEWGMTQLHPYQLADNKKPENAEFEFDLMGFYRFIDNVPTLAQARVTETGVAYRTYSTFLRDASAESYITDKLDLQPQQGGVGYKLKDGQEAFVLWAETTADGNEWVTTEYSVPADLVAAGYRVAEWNFSEDPKSEPLTEKLTLTGTPVFLAPSTITGGTSALGDLGEEVIELTVYPNPVVEQLNVALPASPGEWTLEIFDVSGRKAAVTSQTLRAGATKAKFNVANLPVGTYELRALNGDDEQLAVQFVKD